jgi:hypothetical protein
MALGNWTVNYQNLPRNKNNPGYGAPSIRELKSEIAIRMENEHFAGPSFEYNETPYTASLGYHREGSARARVTDPFSNDTDRASAVVTNQSAGRIIVDVSDRDSPASAQIEDRKRLYNGDPAEGLAQFDASLDDKKQKIQVYAYDDALGATLELKDIFNADRYMDTKYDQFIDGLKRFEFSPEVNKLQIDGDEYTGDLIAKLDNLENNEGDQVVKLSVIRDSLHKIIRSMLLGNLAESSVDTLIEELVSNYRDSDGYINDTLQIKAIDAKSVTGVLWA